MHHNCGLELNETYQERLLIIPQLLNMIKLNCFFNIVLFNHVKKKKKSNKKLKFT